MSRVGLVSLWIQMATFLLDPHVAFPLGAQSPDGSFCIQMSPMVTSPTEILGPHSYDLI